MIGASAVKAYIDTSLLVKRYTPELGSIELDDFLCEAQPLLFVSELSRLELASAFSRKGRAGLLSKQAHDAVNRQADADFFSGSIEIVRLESQVIQRALELMRTLTQPVATLDSVHLATALLDRATLFMTNDRQLARAAIESGLEVWPS